MRLFCALHTKAMRWSEHRHAPRRLGAAVALLLGCKAIFKGRLMVLAAADSRGYEWPLGLADSVPGCRRRVAARRYPTKAPDPWLAAIALALAMLIGGCGGGLVLAPVESRDGYRPAPSGYYRVQRGDTLTAISRRAGHSVAALAAWNNLGPPYQINAGSLLRVAPPGGPRDRPARAAAKRDRAEQPRTADAGSRGASASAATSSSGKARSSGGSARVGGLTWQWPVQGRVEQTYRAGDRSRQGIRIATSPGARIAAAGKGTVVYSGSGLKGYGNLIILKHNDHFLSVYGFNRQLLVKQGDRVRAGQVVAEGGQAPNGKYLLHFEIRLDGATVDPLRYLPKR